MLLMRHTLKIYDIMREGLWGQWNIQRDVITVNANCTSSLERVGAWQKTVHAGGEKGSTGWAQLICSSKPKSDIITMTWSQIIRNGRKIKVPPICHLAIHL
jgi:hypothetical protein